MFRLPLCLIALGLPLHATAVERTKGLDVGKPVYKWSAPTLQQGEWIAGATVVAHGLRDDTTVAIESSNVVFGFYNGRLRREVPDLFGGRASLDLGAGVLTPLALGRLAVPEWRSRPSLGLIDVGLPISFIGESTPMLTIRPWASLGLGRVGGGDEDVLVLLGRTATTGGGVRTGIEVHASGALGLLAGQDFGLNVQGGHVRAVSRTTAAVLVGVGPVRANLGLGLIAIAPLDARGASYLGLVPAFDLWARW